MSVVPKPPQLRSGVYDDEPATFGDISAIFKWMIENHVRPSLSSPPLLKDIQEFTLAIDKTASPPRLYTTINGALYYIEWTAA